MSKSLEDYKRLIKHGKESRLLSSFSMLLEWDQETYMPKGAIHFRSEQIELLTALAHKNKTSEAFKEDLNKLINIQTGEVLSNTLNSQQQAALREWRRDFIINSSLPNDFVKTVAKTTSQGAAAWSEAKKSNSFESFLPHLEKIILHMRKKTEFIGWNDHPYDALLDLYEPGMTTKKLDPIFSKLKPFLTNLTQKIAQASKVDTSFLSGHFPTSEQEPFNQFLLKTMGLDPKYSRIDHSEHPFCLGFHPHDVRLTTHNFESNLFRNISAVMHEGGHALYELGLPPKEFGTPLGEYCSIGIHESQSRFWETLIGQGLPFWTFAYPKLQETFPKQLAHIDIDHFYKAINTVTPSLIRIFADEVTYTLHIILRYEIEKALFEKTLPISEIPKVWNQKMEESLGITPDTDANGCMQDIHWASGLFGYFPTYALGNLYASQLFETFKKTHTNWEMDVAKGNLASVNKFLNQNVHQKGRALPALDLIQQATKAPLSPEPYISYLKGKYETIL